MARVTGSLNVRAPAARIQSGAAGGLRLAAEHVLQVANTRVPIEEGTLERSGRATVDEGFLKAAVSYGTKYAVVQHERLDYRHSDGRVAKYLESALTSEAAAVRDLVAAGCRRSINS